jgi:oligoendopeptidase F
MTMKQKVALTLTLALAPIFWAQTSAAEGEVTPTSDNTTVAANSRATEWDLGDLYPDIASWDKAREELATRITTMHECKGKLGDSADTLASCMDDVSNTYKDLLRLYVFAFLAKDTDLANSEYRERASLAQTLLTQMGEATSYIDPELITIDGRKLNGFLKNNERLKDHNFSILNVRRQAKHILSPEEERILAAAADALSTASSAYEVLTNAEMPWPEVTLSDGTTIRLDSQG